MTGWRFYHYGLISTSAPHEQADLSILQNWKKLKIDGRRPLYIEYTDRFDCGRETQWWYCIKDSLFSLDAVKAKRRYEINKGLKNFEVKAFAPEEYLSEINEIRTALFAQYPAEYRSANNPQNVLKTYQSRQKNWISLGAFREGQLCGYLDAEIKDGYIDFTRLCVDPQYEKLGINFALVYGLLLACEPYIIKGFYICDGARTIRHKTSFQDWLVKYFDFRNAYCELHMECRASLRILLILSSPLKPILSRTHNKKLYNLYCFLKLAEISTRSESCALHTSETTS